jgi:hypothetical protein
MALKNSRRVQELPPHRADNYVITLLRGVNNTNYLLSCYYYSDDWYIATTDDSGYQQRYSNNGIVFE